MRIERERLEKQKRENEGIDVSLRNFNIFIKRLKAYIGDTNESVELLGQEPGQLVFNLFLEKIGLTLIYYLHILILNDV